MILKNKCIKKKLFSEILEEVVDIFMRHFVGKIGSKLHLQ